VSEHARKASVRIVSALNADESGELDQLLRSGREEDLEALRAVAFGELPIDAPNSRAKAIYALGRWRDPTLPGVLEQILPELDRQSRIAAIDALGRVGDMSNVIIIARYADDDSEQVRKAVVKALARIGGDEANMALQGIARGDNSPWIRELAESAAGRL
jgi:HEAT repeat protein